MQDMSSFDALVSTTTPTPPQNNIENNVGLYFLCMGVCGHPMVVTSIFFLCHPGGGGGRRYESSLADTAEPPAETRRSG